MNWRKITIVIIKKHTQLDDSFKPKNTPFPNFKQNVNTRLCPVCGRQISLTDSHRAEDFCMTCGLVRPNRELTTNNLIYGSWSTERLYTGTGYTRTEKEFMKAKHIRTRTFYKQDEQNKLDYKYTIDSFKHDLCLNSVDIQNVWIIIHDCGGLKNIHRKLNYERILLAICRYILKQKGIHGYLVNLSNSLYREYKLSQKDCMIVERNIETRRSIKKCNT